VIDAVFRADPAGGGAEDGQIGEGVRNEGGVEIVDGGRALKGPLVRAPSEPAPVVEGDLPVRLAMKSMNASGSSW
jgi:hypothetical protein